jgi:Golgi phosphoprotein 3 (GPP34)
MLIAERLLLIACDPVTGDALWPREQPSPELIVAGAIAAELVAQGRLPLHDGLFHTDTQIPTGHPLLKEALHDLRSEKFDSGELLRVIANRMDPLVKRLLDGLFRRDILHRAVERDWLRKKVRYPVRSMQARNEALEALGTAAHSSDLSGLALLFLADASGLLALSMRTQDYELAKQRIVTLNNVTSHTDQQLRGMANIRSALLR